jgi:hypothetical protein
MVGGLIVKTETSDAVQWLKEGSMKAVHARGILAFVMLLLPVFTVDGPALADDTSCWFEADVEGVYLTVYEREFNSPADEIIWHGFLHQGQRQLIHSRAGRLTYDYRLASSDLTDGDNQTDCRDGETITIP